MEACYWLEMTSLIQSSAVVGNTAMGQTTLLCILSSNGRKSGDKYMPSVEKGDARADIGPIATKYQHIIDKKV